MIHTDGTPTIANAPREATIPVVSDWAPNPDFVLCEREHSGLRVALLRVGTTSAIALQLGNEAWNVKTVADDKALDAFNHPYLYV